MNEESVTMGTPWYQNSWPWFLVILLVVSVVGSLATVVIAFRHRDVDVRDRVIAHESELPGRVGAGDVGRPPDRSIPIRDPAR